MEAPALGIYPGIPFQEYRQWECVNSGAVRWGDVTMAHMQAAMQGLLDTDSEAKKFGRAIHARLLEPAVFHEQYLISAPCQTKLKSGDNKGKPCGSRSSRYWDGQWYCKTHAPAGAEEPLDYIDDEELGRIERIVQAVKGHPVVKLIAQHGGFESSVVWSMKDVTLKSRLDKLILEGNCPPTIIDLKKVQVGKGGNAAFAKSIDDWGYSIQASMYVDAVKSLTGVECNFIWIVIEDKEPHLVNVLKCDQVSLKIGRFQYDHVLESWQKAVSSGVYPGYGQDIQLCGLPDYAKRRFKSLLE